MNIEHVALAVKDPPAVAAWYVENLGFTVARSSDQSPYAHFLSASGEGVMLEIYNNPAVEPPDYASMDPLVLHIAFQTDDVAAAADRLKAAGASEAQPPRRLPNGDTVAMLRDPWGLAVQLVRRASRMC